RFLAEARLVGATAAGLGARARCVDRLGLGMETEYVSFAPPERVAGRMTRGPRLLASFAGARVYRALRPGVARVTLKYSLSTRPALLRPLLDPLVLGFFSLEMERRLRGLKRELERLARRDRGL